jgi:hypothetical protein
MFKKKFNEVQDILELKTSKTRTIRNYELSFLQELARSLKSNSVVLEVGSFIGKSSVCIAEGLENNGGHLFCLDNFTESLDNQEEQFYKNTQGYNNISLIKEDSLIFFKNNKEHYNMIFIDGNHTIKYFVNDLVYSIKCSTDIVCGHDFTISSPWIIDAIQFLCERFGCVYQVKGYVWRLENFEMLKNIPTDILISILENHLRNNKLYYLNNHWYINE